MDKSKQLDDVLKYLNEHINIKKSTTYQQIQEKFKGIYSHKLIFLIIDKLIKDGFVEEKSTFTIDENGNRKPNDLKVNNITFEGSYFIEHGGYCLRETDKIQENERHNSEIRRRKLNDSLLVIGSIIAAIAGSVIAYWEIKKQYPLFPYWH